MSRRKRRHADPAQLPRRDPAERGRREERDRAARELARVDDALARATAVMGAAIVYFGFWAVNALLGLFPPAVGIDLTHPQFLVGLGALGASLLLARYLASKLTTRRLVLLGTGASAAFGAIVLAVGAVFVVATPTESFALVAFGMAISWLIATVWVALLARRATRLLGAVGEAD